jgi:hypothetical protein
MRVFRSKQFPVLFAAVISLAVTAHAQIAPTPKQEPIRIAFVGDSMADGLRQGVARTIAKNSCLKSLIDTERFGKNGTGLTRLDKFNWPRELLAIGKRYKADIYVISVGLNDRNPIHDPDGRNAQYNSREWPEVYRDKIDKMLKSATGMKAGVVWLGIPSLRDSNADKEAKQKNALYAAAIVGLNDPSVRYIEPWRIKTDGEDPFSTYGPGEDGNLIALRTPDGSHFTPAGYDLLGAYLYPKIVETLRQRGIDIDKLCPAKSEANPDTKSGVKPD